MSHGLISVVGVGCRTIPTREVQVLTRTRGSSREVTVERPGDGRIISLSRILHTRENLRLSLEGCWHWSSLGFAGMLRLGVLGAWTVAIIFTTETSGHHLTDFVDTLNSRLTLSRGETGVLDNILSLFDLE